MRRYVWNKGNVIFRIGIVCGINGQMKRMRTPNSTALVISSRVITATALASSSLNPRIRKTMKETVIARTCKVPTNCPSGGMSKPTSVPNTNDIANTIDVVIPFLIERIILSYTWITTRIIEIAVAYTNIMGFPETVNEYAARAPNRLCSPKVLTPTAESNAFFFCRSRPISAPTTNPTAILTSKSALRNSIAACKYHTI